MSSARVSCHGVYFHPDHLCGVFSVFTRGEEAWHRQAGLLALRLQDVHLMLASPFLLHDIVHSDGVLREWQGVETDGAFFRDCIAGTRALSRVTPRLQSVLPPQPASWSAWQMPT